jgi:hypothetical protein
MHPYLIHDLVLVADGFKGHGNSSGNLERKSLMTEEWELTLFISTDKVVVSSMASGELIPTRSIPGRSSRNR